MPSVTVTGGVGEPARASIRPWSSNETYRQGDLVIDPASDGSWAIWRAINYVAANQAHPADLSSRWQEVGRQTAPSVQPWSPSGAYQRGDLVQVGVAVFLATSAHVAGSVRPGVGVTGWQQIGAGGGGGGGGAVTVSRIAGQTPATAGTAPAPASGPAVGGGPAWTSNQRMDSWGSLNNFGTTRTMTGRSIGGRDEVYVAHTDDDGKDIEGNLRAFQIGDVLDWGNGEVTPTGVTHWGAAAGARTTFQFPQGTISPGTGLPGVTWYTGDKAVYFGPSRTTPPPAATGGTAAAVAGPLAGAEGGEFVNIVDQRNWVYDDVDGWVERTHGTPIQVFSGTATYATGDLVLVPGATATDPYSLWRATTPIQPGGAAPGATGAPAGWVQVGGGTNTQAVVLVGIITDAPASEPHEYQWAQMDAALLAAAPPGSYYMIDHVPTDGNVPAGVPGVAGQPVKVGDWLIAVDSDSDGTSDAWHVARHDRLTAGARHPAVFVSTVATESPVHQTFTGPTTSATVWMNSPGAQARIDAWINRTGPNAAAGELFVIDPTAGTMTVRIQTDPTITPRPTDDTVYQISGGSLTKLATYAQQPQVVTAIGAGQAAVSTQTGPPELKVRESDIGKVYFEGADGAAVQMFEADGVTPAASVVAGKSYEFHITWGTSDPGANFEFDVWSEPGNTKLWTKADGDTYVTPVLDPHDIPLKFDYYPTLYGQTTGRGIATSTGLTAAFGATMTPTTTYTLTDPKGHRAALGQIPGLLGEWYVNTTDNKAWAHDGSKWVLVHDGAGGTGGNVAITLWKSANAYKAGDLVIVPGTGGDPVVLWRAGADIGTSPNAPGTAGASGDWNRVSDTQWVISLPAGAATLPAFEGQIASFQDDTGIGSLYVGHGGAWVRMLPQIAAHAPGEVLTVETGGTVAWKSPTQQTSLLVGIISDPAPDPHEYLWSQINRPLAATFPPGSYLMIDHVPADGKIPSTGSGLAGVDIAVGDWMVAIDTNNDGNSDSWHLARHDRTMPEFGLVAWIKHRFNTTFHTTSTPFVRVGGVTTQRFDIHNTCHVHVTGSINCWGGENHHGGFGFQLGAWSGGPTVGPNAYDGVFWFHGGSHHNVPLACTFHNVPRGNYEVSLWAKTELGGINMDAWDMVWFDVHTVKP